MMSGLEFLTGFARILYPDADVYMEPSSGDYRISVKVSRKELIADKQRACARARAALTPRVVRRRRLHWGKKH